MRSSSSEPESESERVDFEALRAELDIAGIVDKAWRESRTTGIDSIVVPWPTFIDNKFREVISFFSPTWLAVGGRVPD